jgi:hypothetical protein
MRPKILSYYKNEQLEVMLENSKSGELWIARFSPLPWGSIELGNAAILYKKTGFLGKETLTNEEFNAVLEAMSNVGYKDICMIKREKDVLIFSKYDQTIGLLTGIDVVIKKLSNSIKIKAGISDIDKDRCCIVVNKYWEDGNKPAGIYTMEDLN